MHIATDWISVRRDLNSQDSSRIMSSTTRPKIAITMGDPAGVGPEICLRLLEERSLLEHCIPVIVGDASVLMRAGCVLGVADIHPTQVISSDQWPEFATTLVEPAVLDSGSLGLDSITPGVVNAQTGQASFGYIESAIELALNGSVDAVTTAPIHKEAFSAAGVPFPGHTELFAARTNSGRTAMMLTSREITCSLVTTHVGLNEVPQLLTTERILEVIELSYEAMKRIRRREPRLVVCGLNPHAGEHGLFGNQEEERIIDPAIQTARANGLDVVGPLPPDTAFLPARRAETDCYVCMYHDQGLIPLKALAFDQGVNVTLGLPIVRTSVDHGTALDIAWQGKADVRSLIEAVRLATQLVTAD